MKKVAPSILSANFNNLLAEVRSVENAQFLHIDVMDGHFVPNISMGAMIYKNLRKETDMVFDVHLMITSPLKYAKDFIAAGADYLTFHYEIDEDIDEVIKHIKDLGCKVGISIKPKTNPEVLVPYLSQVDLVLVMSVEPGFGGQTFMMNSLEKIQFLYDQRQSHNYHYLIEVDGGINAQTAHFVSKAGVDIIVAGTYIFSNSHRKELIEELKKI